MPAGLTVPTIFTAVDKLSATVKKMGQSIGGFAKTAAFGISKLNDKFNSFFKLGDLSKQFLGLASTAAIAALIISGIKFSAKSLLDYDKAIAQLHNTLYSVSSTGFIKFQQAVDQTAKSTDSSSIDIANSFKTIAQLDQSLAKTPESLSMVSKAALTLARATDSELTPATEGLIGVMHIFGLQANQANRIVNVLAAAQANGAGTLDDQVENYKKWGVVAKAANITLEQSAGINAVFGQYLQKGTESATTLRTAIIRLQKAGAGYQSGVFNINDALKQTIGFYDKLKTNRAKDDFLIKLFGPRGASAGRILLDNAQKIGDVTKAVTGTNDAFSMASRNMNTVYGLLDRIKNRWVDFITSSTEAGVGMTRLKNILRYIITNFDTIVDRLITAIEWFIGLKSAILGIKIITDIIGLFKIFNSLIATTAEASIAGGSLETGIAKIASNFGLAQGAAASFFEFLATFVLPAGLALLTGDALYNAFQNGQDADYRVSARKYNSLPTNSPELKQYLDWSAKQPAGKDGFDLFDKIYTQQQKYPNGFGVKNLSQGTNGIGIATRDETMRPALLNPNAPQVRNNLHGEEIGYGAKGNPIEIFLHDGGGSVKDVKNPNPGINIKLTSTTGKQK